MEQQHEPLVLKVMRLRLPQAHAPSLVGSGGELACEMPKLLLPTSLTQTLVGEVFAGYLHLANHGNVPVRDVVMKVELQVGSLRWALADNSASPVGAIEPGDFFDANITQQLRDAGTYVLSCNVSYRSHHSGESCVFKRSYRFPALHPFAITHRVAQLDTRLLVECALENATAGSIYVTSAALECVEGFSASLVGGWDGCASAVGAGSLLLLKPRGAHHLSFVVEPRSDTIDRAYVRDLDHVGLLALSWRTPDGASGTVVGHRVALKPGSSSALDLRVASCPPKVRAESAFRLEVEVVNRSSQPTEPSIAFDTRQMVGVQVHGATRQAVGRLEPYSTQRASLALLAAVPGRHQLRGVSLVDEISQQSCEFDALCDVLIF